MNNVLKRSFSREEWSLLGRLNSPRKIQDWLNTIPNNTTPGNHCQPPREVIRTKKAHCIEGAVFAALALRIHGYQPLLLDLEASGKDDDHVVALFKMHGHWGAISKTNHAVLRYREPVYRTIRELAMSYFHEYFLQKDGRKTLRCYAKVDLSQFDGENWMTSKEDLLYLIEYLWEKKHIPLLNGKQIRTLRPADGVEREAGEICEWK